MLLRLILRVGARTIEVEVELIVLLFFFLASYNSVEVKIVDVVAASSGVARRELLEAEVEVVVSTGRDLLGARPAETACASSTGSLFSLGRLLGELDGSPNVLVLVVCALLDRLPPPVLPLRSLVAIDLGLRPPDAAVQRGRHCARRLPS